MELTQKKIVFIALLVMLTLIIMEILIIEISSYLTMLLYSFQDFENLCINEQVQSACDEGYQFLQISRGRFYWGSTFILYIAAIVPVVYFFLKDNKFKFLNASLLLLAIIYTPIISYHIAKYGSMLNLFFVVFTIFIGVITGVKLAHKSQHNQSVKYAR